MIVPLFLLLAGCSSLDITYKEPITLEPLRFVRPAPIQRPADIQPKVLTYSTSTVLTSG